MTAVAALGAEARGRGRGGVFWSSLNGAAAVVLPFVVFAAFARLLTPAVFAQFALALACLELLKTFGPLGLYDVLVAHGEDERDYHATAGLLLLGGAGAAMAAYGAVVLASALLFRTAISAVALLMMPKILFDCALLQPQAVLVRRGEVRRLGSRSLVAGSVSGAAGLGLGVAVSAPLGLAAYYLLNSAVTFAMTVAGTGALVRPRWHGACFRAMRRQGLWASGVRLSAAANNYFDQILIGFSFAPLAIGAYNLGKRIEMISMSMASSLSQILWQAVFARAPVERRGDEIGKALASVALVCGVPVMALVVVGERAVPLLFGAKWASAAPVVMWLGLSGLARAMGSVAGAVCTVTRRNGQLLVLSVSAAVMNCAIILGCARFGLEVAAAALAGRNLLHALVMLAMLRELRGRVAGLVLREFAGPLAVVLAVMWGAGQLANGLPALGGAAWRDFAWVALVGGCGALAGLGLLGRRI